MKQHAKTQVRNIAIRHPGRNCLDMRECLYPSPTQKSNVRENVTDHSRFRALRPDNRVPRWLANAFMKHHPWMCLGPFDTFGRRLQSLRRPNKPVRSKTMQSRDRGPPITLAQAYWLGRIPSFACNLPDKGAATCILSDVRRPPKLIFRRWRRAGWTRRTRKTPPQCMQKTQSSPLRS